MDDMVRSRFRGCLLGLAVGDALGAPLEFMTAAEIVARHGRVSDYIGGGWLNVVPGEFTDDTQMMLCIARGIVSLGRFDPDDVAKRFVGWLATRPKDVGNTTRRAISLLAAGVGWREAGLRASTERGRMGAGNGSVMRCAPIALLHYQDTAKLVEDTYNSSLITHGDPRACWSAVALNLLVREAVRGDSEGATERVAGLVEDAEVSEALLAIPRLTQSDLRPSGFAVDTLQTAVACWRDADGFERALVDAVNLGGDADTVGAVCGALAGAQWGLNSVPERWRTGLRASAEILDLADKIARLHQTESAST